MVADLRVNCAKLQIITAQTLFYLNAQHKLNCLLRKTPGRHLAASNLQGAQFVDDRGWSALDIFESRVEIEDKGFYVIGAGLKFPVFLVTAGEIMQREDDKFFFYIDGIFPSFFQYFFSLN